MDLIVLINTSTCFLEKLLVFLSVYSEYYHNWIIEWFGIPLPIFYKLIKKMLQEVAKQPEVKTWINVNYWFMFLERVKQPFLTKKLLIGYYFIDDMWLENLHIYIQWGHKVCRPHLFFETNGMIFRKFGVCLW